SPLRERRTLRAPSSDASPRLTSNHTPCLVCSINQGVAQMFENLKKNLTSWLLALLLLGGVIYHISQADRLNQQISTLQQENERYKAQANGLTEIQNEITTLKASQGNLVQEAQSLRGMYQELQSAAESNVDISDALKSSGIGTATR